MAIHLQNPPQSRHARRPVFEARQGQLPDAVLKIRPANDPSIEQHAPMIGVLIGGGIGIVLWIAILWIVAP